MNKSGSCQNQWALGVSGACSDLSRLRPVTSTKNSPTEGGGFGGRVHLLTSAARTKFTNEPPYV